MSILTIQDRRVRKPFLQSQSSLFSLLQIIFASCFIGISAQIKIPLYFTPVPLTVTTMSVLLVGYFLGSRRGALAAIAYLCQGWMGLPVWAGGAAGFHYFMGPTGGYLLGYAIQAYLVGWLLERSICRNRMQIFGVFLLSICLQLGIGSLWLAQFVGIKKCFLLGFMPFILLDSVKALFLTLQFKNK